MKKRILVIEDDQFLGEVLVQKLQTEGYDVSLVRDGAEGLKQFEAQKPDLVLLDVILPTMSGYQILEARQKDPVLAAIPVIIVSNSGQPVEIDRALSLGVKDYLIKAQLDPQEVFEKVRTYLGEDPKAKAKTNASLLAQKKILWVEDDPFLSTILATKLAHDGCTGIYARDGEEALKFAEKEIPDAILLDLLLPGMSGFEVLKTLHENPRLSAIPVIVLSNLAQREDMDRTKAYGAVKYLVKAEHDLDDIIGEVVQVLNTPKAATAA